VGSAATLAGDFPLLLRRHRCKATPLFSNSVHSILLIFAVTITARSIGSEMPCTCTVWEG
jgi:hypothetical protein